jgi:hypothetical protein
MSHKATIDAIRAEYRDMRFMENQRKRNDLAFQSFIRTLCGYSTQIPKAESAPALKRAQALIAGTAPDDPLAARVEWMRAGSDAALAPFIGMEKEKVKSIEKMVKGLPIWTEWAAEIKGLGLKGIGSLIGEAGDIGAYRSEAAFWKRMGVGVIDGVAQGKLSKTASAEMWITHGYNAKRRSALWTIGDVLIIKQGAGTRYYDMYIARKAVERQKLEALGYTVKPGGEIKAAERDTCVSDQLVHRRAQRWVEKRLLRHMYRAWKRTMEAQDEARAVGEVGTVPAHGTDAHAEPVAKDRVRVSRRSGKSLPGRAKQTAEARP